MTDWVADGGEIAEEPDETNVEQDECIATAAADGVGIYLREIGKFPLLKAEEEAELARSVKRGGTEAATALRQLVESNLRFVVRIARRFEGRGLSLLDLIQEGNIGLIGAAVRFDADRECRFTTLAAWMVRVAISHAIDNQGSVVRVPCGVTEKLRKLAKAQRFLRQEFGREPLSEEVAEYLGIKPAKLAALMLAKGVQVPLDAPAGDEGGETFADIMAEKSAEGPSEVAMSLGLDCQATERVGVRGTCFLH